MLVAWKNSLEHEMQARSSDSGLRFRFGVCVSYILLSRSRWCDFSRSSFNAVIAADDAA
jgi:hypothetical protein